MVSTYILDPLTSIFAWNLGPFVRKTHFVHRPIFARNLGDSTGWLESVRGIEERAWWAGDDLNPVPIGMRAVPDPGSGAGAADGARESRRQPGPPVPPRTPQVDGRVVAARG
jgi:hypothetical protein